MSEMTSPPRAHLIRFLDRLAAAPGWLVAALAVIATVAAGASKLLIDRRWFYWDDTQNGAYGQWFEFGERLLGGDVTLLNPSAWQAGNYLAEGQWGLFSPLTALLALGTHVTTSATLYVTVVKLAFLAVFCLGVFLLTRSFGAAPWWAATAASAAPLAGFTLYMDTASWVTGLINAALFPWVWWGLRRVVYRRRSPLPFVLSGYLLISAGYIFGVIMLVVLLVATLIERLTAAGIRAALSTLLASVFGAAVTVAVFLPGLLTAPATIRSDSGILNDGFLNADLSDLLASPVSTALVSIEGYWGDVAPAPLQYIAWFLPLFPLVWSSAVLRRREVWPLLAVLGAAMLLVLGPSEIGPLRYFVRMMPYVCITVVVLFAVMASGREEPRRPDGRVVAVFGIIAASSFAAWAALPLNWGPVLTMAAISSAGAWAIILIHRARPTSSGISVLAAPLVIAVGLVALAPQADVAPTSPLGQFNTPASTRLMSQVLADVPDDVLVVGDIYSLPGRDSPYEETLFANLWYVSERNVVNVYTVLPFRGFTQDLCIDLRGSTCDSLFPRLFADDARTGLPLVDLLGVNTVQVIRDGRDPVAPQGWGVHDRGRYTTTYVRDEPVPTAGSVAWTSSGTEVEVLESDDTSVSLRVESVPEDGGDVVFKRLNWPGYSIDGAAAIDDPVRGYLLNVRLDPGSEGTTVVVSFSPPGWGASLAALAVAVLLAGVWSMRQRMRPRSASAEVDHR